MNKIKSYKAAGLLYKTDQLVEYFEAHEEKKDDLPIIYRIRTSAFAVALLNNIGLLKEKDGMLITRVNDREISVKTEPVKRLLGDDYEKVLRENLSEEACEPKAPAEEGTPNKETVENDLPDVIVARTRINILKTDSDDGALPLDQNHTAPAENNEHISKRPEQDNDAAASILKNEDPLSSILRKGAKKEDPETVSIKPHVDNRSNKNDAPGHTPSVIKRPEPNKKESIVNPVKNNNNHEEKPLPKKNPSQWLEIDSEGIKNYVISDPNHEEQKPRKSDEFLYDRYIITQPDRPDIRCIVFPVTVPNDGQQRCDIMAMADNGENISIAASNNEAHIAMLKIGTNTICISGFITDGIFTTSATFPGMKEKHVVKTEVRPASKDSSIGHIVYKADKADTVHLFPALMAADKNVVCPAFGVNYQTFGANKSMTPFLSEKGDITVKCEKSRIRFVTFWKDGSFGIKTEINPRG